MFYVVEYEITSLLFLIVLTVKFFQSRQFPSRRSRIFGLIMLCGIADITLDLASSYLIEYISFFSKELIYIVCTAFYALQILFPAGMLAYIMVLTGKFKKNKLAITALLLPVSYFLLRLLLSNPFTGEFFYVDLASGVKYYVHGEKFILLYVCAAIYMAVSVFIANLYHKVITPEERATLNALTAIILLSVVVQYYYPAYLLTGVAISLAIMLMYFTLQNPNDLIDVITGVFNYAAFISLTSELSKDHREYKMISVEINGMRQINNIFGLEHGNKTLRQVADFFDGLSKEAWVFRVMGTRFVIITYTDKNYYRVINAVSGRFENPWMVDASDVMLTVAVRHFTADESLGSAENILNLLDEVYSNVDESKNSTELIDMRRLENINRSLTIEAVLRDALIKQEGFYMVYQPIYSIGEGRFVSAEALLRFKHVQMGAISPGEFIPIAEKCGLIYEIDELVVSLVCNFIKRVQPDKNLDLRTINVNLSAAEFMTKSFPARIGGIVEREGIPTGTLTFEITETAAKSNSNVLEAYIRHMENKGFDFALDDFGTGYSNIVQLINLPFKTVKIDRSLVVSENGNDFSNGMILAPLLKAFKTLGYSTVVEGIETQEQLDTVINIGDIDCIQGYFYAMPMEENEFIDFLIRQRVEN